MFTSRGSTLSTPAQGSTEGDATPGVLAPSRRRLPLQASTASHARQLPLQDEVRSVDRRSRPVHAVWELTLRCDLACRHCGSRAGRARPDELSPDEALDLVGQLSELGVQELTLIGGEVYLYQGWQRIVTEVRRQGMSCAVVSGGRGITEAVARDLKDSGVQSVSISVDGPRHVHDLMRGNGSYQAALGALGHCRDAGLPIAVNSQVNRLNLGLLGSIYDRVVEFGCHGWQMQLTVPAGRAADEPELILQPYDLIQLFPELSRLQAQCAAQSIKFLPGNNIGYFGPHEHQLRGPLRCASNASCSAGRLVLGIEANGDIKGCPSLPTRGWVGGNVRDHRLQAIWEQAPALRYTRDLTVDKLWGFCKTCYYAEACMAGCTWTATSLFSKPGNNPYCHHRALTYQAQGQRERLVPVAQAPGEAFDHGLWQIVVEALGEPAPPTACGDVHGHTRGSAASPLDPT